MFSVATSVAVWGPGRPGFTSLSNRVSDDPKTLPMPKSAEPVPPPLTARLPAPTWRQRLHRAISHFVFTAGAHFYAWMTWTPIWREHCGSLADHFPHGPAPSEGDGAAPARLRVLDLGIGPGISGIGILDRRPLALVVGLDFSRTMLRLAGRYLRRASLPPEALLPLLHGDVMNLPFADASFDVITHHSFLYLLSQRERALTEMARVLRPGGSYVFLEPRAGGSLTELLSGPGEFRFKLSMFLWRVFSRGFGRFEAAELQQLLSRHGFGEIELEPTLSGLGFLGRARR